MGFEWEQQLNEMGIYWQYKAKCGEKMTKEGWGRKWLKNKSNRGILFRATHFHLPSYIPFRKLGAAYCRALPWLATAISTKSRDAFNFSDANLSTDPWPVQASITTWGSFWNSLLAAARAHPLAATQSFTKLGSCCKSALANFRARPYWRTAKRHKSRSPLMLSLAYCYSGLVKIPSNQNDNRYEQHEKNTKGKHREQH